MVVNDDGTRRRNLTPPRHFEQVPRASDAQWSPTGQQILFTAGISEYRSEIWTINADGTRLRPFREGDYARWSPDGRQVALRPADGQIAILTAEGKLRKTVRLGNVSDPGPGALEWSRDGHFIALDSVTADESGLVVQVVDLRRGTVRTLTPPGEDEFGPVWSPDGRWLALTRRRATGMAYERIDVWLTRPDGSERRRLVEYHWISGSDQSVLAWSPDGQALILRLGRSLYRRSFADGRLQQITAPLPKYVYTFSGASTRGTSVWLRFIDNDLNNTFFVFDGAGRLVRRIESTRGDSVSPDGKWLVGTNGGRLIVMRSDGSDERDLTPRSLEMTEFALGWSGDGTKLAFTRLSSKAPYRRGNFIMRGDGSGERRIGDGRSPQLAPDGNSVLVHGARGITVVDLDGHGSRVVAGQERVRDPAWSPDGRSIAFVRDEGIAVGRASFELTGSALYTVRPDGSGLRRIRGGEGGGFGRPAWTADGKSILVSRRSSARQSDGGLHRIDLAGGGESTNVTPDASVRIESAVFAPDGSRAALASDRGIESVSLEDGRRTVLVKGSIWGPYGWDPVVWEESLSRVWAAWSPDGEKLAYLRGGLRVVNKDGSSDRLVSRAGEGVLSFAWRPPTRSQNVAP